MERRRNCSNEIHGIKNMSESIEILDCPFCGGLMFIYNPTQDGNLVYCNEPKCGIYKIKMYESSWNTRTPSQLSTTLVKNAAEDERAAF